MVMEVCECGKEAERVAERVSGAQNLYGQETPINPYPANMENRVSS
jgi:hypothetical protein